MSPPAKLTYFAGRGRAEIVRLTLSAVGIQWEEEHLSDPERVDKLRKDGLSLFMQFPVLEIDGLKLTQTFSIVRYLANKNGLMGKTSEESAQIDILSEGARDMAYLGFAGEMFTPKDKREGLIQNALKKSRERYLPIFEKVLKENGSNGYLVGTSLSMADLMFLEVLLWAYEYDATLADEFPTVKKFHDTVTSLPQLKAYLDGPQRHPQPDIAYVQKVATALSMSF